MEEDFLRDHPELRPFVLSDVQLTGTRIGSGAYGRVEEVAFPVGAACKTLFAFLQEGDDSSPELPKAAAEFVRECQLMSTVRHPNVVQFLGVAFFAGSRTARPRHGTTADESSRLARSRHAAPARRPLAASLLLRGSQVLRSAQRGVRPGLPARPVAARHPPRLVGQKRSPELGYGGKDRRFGRGSYRATYESCSHHDNGTWGLDLHASRGLWRKVEIRRQHRHLLSRSCHHFHNRWNLPL